MIRSPRQENRHDAEGPVFCPLVQRRAHLSIVPRPQTALADEHGAGVRLGKSLLELFLERIAGCQMPFVQVRLQSGFVLQPFRELLDLCLVLA